MNAWTLVVYVAIWEVYSWFNFSINPLGNGQAGSNACTLPNGRPLTKARRKEYRLMSDDERQRFHAAVLAIKQNGEYDK